MGAVDWMKPVNVSLVGGAFGQGYIQGGPFADDEVADVTSRFGPRPSMTHTISVVKLPGETWAEAANRLNTTNFVDGGDGSWLVTITTGDKHLGLDLHARSGRGAVVHSVGDAKVNWTVSVLDYPQQGNWIELSHGRFDDQGIFYPNGWKTRVAHLLDVPVFSFGERIYKGQAIGRMNNTGNSTGDHTHFEVIFDGINVDPLFTLLAALDIGQIPPPPPPMVGDPSTPIHMSVAYELQYKLGTGVLIFPENVVHSNGNERYVSNKDTIPYMVPVGKLFAKHALYVPLEDLP